MIRNVTAIEVKRGNRISYVGTYARGQRIQLVDDATDAANFKDNPDLITIAASSLRLPTDRVYGFSSPSVDSIAVVELEIEVRESQRTPIVR